MSQKSSRKAWHRFIVSPLNAFIKDSRSVGILLIICTIVSLLITNFIGGEGYVAFWEDTFPNSIAGLPNNLELIINDALMAVFFLAVGMEIKVEMVEGALASLKKSALPIVAAIGGMVVPALIYAMWNSGGDFAHGWGIPMATDIAFSLGILSLLGKRVPLGLKVLLAALAIIDDLGAIVAIAIFYTEELHWTFLGIGFALTAVLILLNRMKVKPLWIYLVLAAGLWYCLFNSGVHATLSGVILAFTLPMNHVRELGDRLHLPVDFIILPLFALANTAIIFPHNPMEALTDSISFGVAMGLVLGKPIGIFLTCFGMVKSKLAVLPNGVNWHHILGMGLLAGIGFTMSIFISMLAFNDAEAITNAKLAILIASTLSGIIGFFYLKVLLGKEKR